MLYRFKKDINAAQSCKNIYEVFEEVSITEKACQLWFLKFRSEELTQKPRTGSPT